MVGPRKVPKGIEWATNYTVPPPPVNQSPVKTRLLLKRLIVWIRGLKENNKERETENTWSHREHTQGIILTL